MELFWVKTRENAVDNFDFTRKCVKTFFSEKLLKMLEFCQNSIFGQKFDFSNSVQLYILWFGQNMDLWNSLL